MYEICDGASPGILLGLIWHSFVIRPLDFLYKWRGFRRTPYDVGDAGEDGFCIPKSAMAYLLDFCETRFNIWFFDFQGQYIGLYGIFYGLDDPGGDGA